MHYADERQDPAYWEALELERLNAWARETAWEEAFEADQKAIREEREIEALLTHWEAN
jgi:hypothetical protein